MTRGTESYAVKRNVVELRGYSVACNTYSSVTSGFIIFKTNNGKWNWSWLCECRL